MPEEHAGVPLASSSSPPDRRRPLWARVRDQALGALSRSAPEGEASSHRPAKFQATPAERQLFGVARWPVVCDPQESEAHNLHYGTEFAKETLRLGRRIASNKYQHFTHVWASCRQWRAGYENRYGGGDPDFGSSRLGTTVGFSTPIVAGQRYGYLVDRICELPEATHVLIAVPKQVNGQPAPGLMQVREVSYTATTELRGDTFRLTQLKAWLKPDGSPFDTAPGLAVKVGDMIHTPVTRNFIPLLREADQLFHAAIDPGKTLDQRIQILGHMHWILAHAMPDKRGSAAKTEMAVRAIAYAMGHELPPFAPGIVPDLEAFLTPREDFANNYVGLFARSPL